ncbi:hypothetical protein J6590_053620 [Homalodisca vitripennis]|nr:hypothetical protein J6590_053620 [Homalodisca vitripennis]
MPFLPLLRGKTNDRPSLNSEQVKGNNSDHHHDRRIRHRAVAEWTDEQGFTPVAAKYVRLRPPSDIEKNKTYIVTTIVEEPYIMLRTPEKGENLTGNDRFEGYCKDLADLIAKRLGINCEYIE